MPDNRIAVVDAEDNIIGAEERSVARAKGLRHRIVRVFIINSRGQILLQRRSLQRLDTPGRWDQSVGGHVDEGEDYLTAARRETKEELGIEPADFRQLGKYYIERPGPGGTIRRFHAVFMAHSDAPIHADSTEISEIQWLNPPEIQALLDSRPDDFTTNFHRAFALVVKSL